MSGNSESKEIERDLRFLAKSSLFVFIGLFLSKVLTYIYRVLIARYFGPDSYGVFSLALIVLGIFISLSSVGLPGGISRFVPYYLGEKQYGKVSYLLKFSGFVMVLISLFLGIVMFLTSDLIALNFFEDSNLVIPLKIFSLLVPLSVIGNLFLDIIKSHEKPGWYSFLSNILSNFSKVAALLFLILIGVSVNSIYLSYAFSIIAVLIVSLLFLRKIFGTRKTKDISAKEKRYIRREILSYSWPLIVLGLITKLYAWTDSLTIGYFLNATEVGYYNAALPIALLLSIAPEIFMVLFVPIINRSFSKKNNVSTSELSKQVSKWIFIINIPLFFILIIFPGVLLNLLFGPEYLVAENALRILSLGSFLSSFLYISEKLILMKGKSKVILINVVITLAINLVLNILLVPKYGIAGAAASTSFVWFLMAIILTTEGYHYTKIIPIRRKVIKISLISLIPLAVILLARKFVEVNIYSLVLIGFLYVLLYVLLIIFTKALDRNDLLIIKAIRKKIGF